MRRNAAQSGAHIRLRALPFQVALLLVCNMIVIDGDFTRFICARGTIRVTGRQ